MIWSHVTGWLMSMPAFSTDDLRYQSTCVFDQNGKTTSLPPQVAAAVAPLKDWSVSCDCMSSGIGAKNPASANSAVNGGSIDIRSMPESCAASRLASWMRCWLASCGRTCVLIVDLPLLASEQFFATAPWPPLSGLRYQTSSGGPELPPHAASTLEAQVSARPSARARLRGTPR